MKNLITPILILLLSIPSISRGFDLKGDWIKEYDFSMDGKVTGKTDKKIVQIDKGKKGIKILYKNSNLKPRLTILPKLNFHNLFLQEDDLNGNYHTYSIFVLENNNFARGTWVDNKGNFGDIILKRILDSKDKGKKYSKKYQGIGIQGNYGSYQWNTAYPVPFKTGASIIFQANAKNDIYISFAKEKKNISKMYEIVIGGWENTRSLIRYGRQGLEIFSVDKNKNPEALVEYDKTQWYWASVIEGKIMAGKGRTPGENIFMETEYSDEDLNTNIHWVAFSSWDNPVLYKNVTIER